MKRKFELTWSDFHRQWKIELADATEAEYEFLEHAISANHMDDPFYQARMKAHPFLQGQSYEGKGWILIEFWSTKDRADEYIKWLNEQWEKTP